ncbi:MAG: FKBP-type peptidyl-prolyl cis-trans isomerase [Lachnospiraceae bacterium]|nr:FKBP-type peptidyl-prolyl cis-trans isomerase [Lachnospiraceae bacterium]
MRIAVTYEDGQIFQHFGHAEGFKVYEVQDNKVVSSEVITAGVSGHGAMAALLSEKDIQILICGGIGGGAQNALDEAGIEVMAGQAGDADEAVEAYLRGELVNSGVNCDHHDHGEDQECGGDCDCGGGCASGGCGGCGGGCGGGSFQIVCEGPNAGKTVRVHYRGTYNDGTQFDSSYDRGEPLQFVSGVGMMIKGFDEAAVKMAVGEKVQIHLMPEEAYGMPNPNAILTIAIADLPGSENLNVGERVYLANENGQPFPVTVTAKTDSTITLDANHEMAGKELNFEIEMVEICD